MMERTPKPKSKNRIQSYSTKYSDEFSFIVPSRLSQNHAFCQACRRDISIAHGGRSDIVHHAKTLTHSRAISQEYDIAKTQPKITFFGAKNDNEHIDTTRAECLFAAFYLEHNIPVAAADHMGQLLRQAFPKSEEVKKFRSARTKTTKIIKEMAKESISVVGNKLQRLPFSVATDGSHTKDAKLYPVVITMPDEESSSIKTCLLSVPVLTEQSTGENIGKLILSELKRLNIPIKNCLSMGSDNAPVMLGKKNGVISSLKVEQPHMIALGCPCHLINLAANHAAKLLPVSIDSLLIDIYYYLEHSVNRKLRLKELQELSDVDVEKVLKHSCTRWLSLGQALPRLLRQWDVLTSFIKEEMKIAAPANKPTSLQPLMKSYTIPRKKSLEDTVSVKRKAEAFVSEKMKNKKQKTSNTTLSNAATLSVAPSSSAGTESMPSNSKLVNIYHCLQSPTVRAYSHFLQYSITFFEKTNISLQTREPLIHKLNDILHNFLKNLMSAFLKSEAFLEKELRYVAYKSEANHKKDIDINIGNSTYDIIECLDGNDLILFFKHVKQYYIEACDYILSSFPIDSDILVNAQVADYSKRSKSSISSVRFFTSKFKCLVVMEKEESFDEAMDKLLDQFTSYTTHDFDTATASLPADKFWFRLRSMKDVFDKPMFDKLSHFMLGLLTIPHSNSECERTFSQVRKNKTDFRGSLSDHTLSSILVTKSFHTEACYKRQFSNSFLKKVKSSTDTDTGCDSESAE